jgi:hypothetical protein
MFGILTDKGKVNYVSLDDFISIDKMNYFETYFEKQFVKFCDDLPQIVEKNDFTKKRYKEYLKNKGLTKVDLFNSFMSTYSGDEIGRDGAWKLIKTYVPEFIEYLHDNVVDYLYEIFIQFERKGNNVPFHRDWAPDGLEVDDYGMYPDKDEYRSSGAAWTWFRFSDTKKLYVSDIDGKDDVSKRIPMKSYGAVFNGRDFHGCYDDSYGYSSRIYATLKQDIIDNNEIDILRWTNIYPPQDYMKNEKCLV